MINDNEKGNEDDDDNDDIVEKWKRGRFRPRVENRRPIGGNFRGRGRRGAGRGNFGGNFQRSILDVRRQEARQRRDRRERPRSKSHEADESGRKRLPGRFDRRRTRSESQEHSLLKDGETASRHGRKDYVEERSHRRPGHAGQDKPTATERKRRPIESEYGRGIKDKRSRSREGKGRFESDGKAISGEGYEKTDKKQGDTQGERPNQRWDQIEKSEGDLRGLTSDAREKETIDKNREEMKTAQEKSFRGRWDKNEDDDDDVGRKLLDASEGRYVRERKDDENENTLQKAAKVDMFGRDISKRYEYIEKKKTNNRPREAVQKEDDSKRKGAKEEKIEILENSEHSPVHPSSMNRVGSLEEDVGSESDNDIRKGKEKLKKKQKHKKKEKKKKKQKKRKEEDSGSADSNKDHDPVAKSDTAHDSKRTEAAIAELNRIEKIQQEQELEYPVGDQQKPGFSISLDAEAEMRERIKLKMKNRSKSLKSENVLNLEAFSKDSTHFNESAREEKNEHIAGYMKRSPVLAGTKRLQLNASEDRVNRKNDRLSRSAPKEGLDSDNSEEVLVLSSNKYHYARKGIKDSRRLSDHSTSGEENSLERASRSKAQGENDRRNLESSSKRKARVVRRSDASEESESEYRQIARPNIGKKRGKREIKVERKRKMDDDQNSFTSDEETEQVARRNRRQENEEHGKRKGHRDTSNDFHSSDEETRKKKVGSSLGRKTKGNRYNSDNSSSESNKVKGEKGRKNELRKNQNDSSESFSSDEEEPRKRGSSYTQRGKKLRDKDEKSVAKKKRSKVFESESGEETRRVKDKENYSSRRRGRQDTKKVWKEITCSSSNNTDAGSGNEQSDSYESRKGSSKKALRKKNIEKQSREGLIHRDDDREAKRGSKKEVKRQKEPSKGKKRHYSDEDSSDDGDKEQKKYRGEVKSRYHKAPKEKIRKNGESSAGGLEDLDDETETKKISKEENKTRKPKREDGGKYKSDSDAEKVNEPVNDQQFKAEAKYSYSKLYADNGSKSLKRAGRWDVTRKSREVEEPKSGGQGIGSEVVAGRETSRILAPKIRHANIDADDPYISYEKNDFEKSLLATEKDSSDALGSSIPLTSSKDGFEVISKKAKIVKRDKDSGSSSDVSLYGDIDIEALSRKKKHVRKSEDSAAVVKLQDRAHKQRENVDSDDSLSDENAKASKRETRRRRLRDRGERDSRLRSTSYERSKRSAKSRASRESSSPRRKSHRHRSDSRSSGSERESSRRRRSRDLTRKKNRRSRSPKQRSSSRTSLSSSSSAERWRRGSKSKRSNVRKKTKSSKTRQRDHSSSFESSTSSSSGANRPKKRRK